MLLYPCLVSVSWSARLSSD